MQQNIRDIDIKTDPRFAILNVADLLNIRIVGKKGTERIARCPFCGDSENPQHGHLYLNTATNQYYCVRCNKGGYALGMYANVMGIEKYQAIHEIARARENRITYSPQPLFYKENGIASIEERHKVYSKLLSLLTLDSKHVDNLICRGLTLSYITKKEYRSIPSKNKAIELSREIVESGLSLKGIPGFYKNKSGNWTFVTYQGFFIPVRDVRGRIQGLQVRLDNINKGNKYRWFSSRHYKEGTRAKSWAGVSKGDKKNFLVITEGPLKADVASYLSGATFIGVPGVNAIKDIENMVYSIPKENRRKIYIAYDMDLKENKQVARARRDLIKTLKKHFKTKIQTLEWPKKAGNGIDDFLLSKEKGNIKFSIKTMWKMRNCLALLQ